VSEANNQGILNPGDVLNNTYVISDLIASGGTGEVYRATNRASGREIAVKILKAEFAQDEQFTNLMKREASVLHEVIDDCVVRYYDLLESDLHGGFLFIVMEFIHGHSLVEYMRDTGPVDADVLLQVAERILRGLKAAHDKNAFHRDLSPDNILLRDGDPAQATLIDFGIAKDVNEGAKTVVGDGFAGKYQYAAPEQMEGKADARSDLYSLGMTLIGAYRGQSPSAGSSLMEIISAKANKPDISDMDGKLSDLVSQLVEPDPENRLQSAATALAFLTGSGALDDDDGRTVIVQRSGTRAATQPPMKTEGTIESLQKAMEEPKKSKTGVMAALFVVLLAVIGGTAWFTGLIAPSSETKIPTPDVTVITNPALPLADPYVLNIVRTGTSEPLALRGNLPSAEAIPRITTALEEQLDTFAVLAEITAADGVPFEGWADRIVQIAVNFNQLDTWSVAASGTTVTLIGQAQNAAEKTALLNAAKTAIIGTDLTIVDQITISTPSINQAELSTALQSLGTCGPLLLSGGTGGIIAPEESLSVYGVLANATDITRIQAFLTEMAPGRPIQTGLTVLNNGVCSALNILPDIPSGKLRLEYGHGTKDAVVVGSTFHLDDNPVIDIELDAKQTGYLSVIFIDLADQVFHLLPHQARKENKLQSIGTVTQGTRRIRVTFPISEASVAQLGFKVVEPLGANLLIAVVTPEPLFDDIRPRAESNAAFLAAVQDRLKQLDGESSFVTFRSLITAR
jgi:serine/threonine-protein kinase